MHKTTKKEQLEPIIYFFFAASVDSFCFDDCKLRTGNWTTLLKGIVFRPSSIKYTQSRYLNCLFICFVGNSPSLGCCHLCKLLFPGWKLFHINTSFDSFVWFSTPKWLPFIPIVQEIKPHLARVASHKVSHNTSCVVSYPVSRPMWKHKQVQKRKEMMRNLRNIFGLFEQVWVKMVTFLRSMKILACY